jgi:carbamoyl-phosphate synthase large subunit
MVHSRVPEPGEGLLLGGQTDRNWLTVVVDYLAPLGYKFYAAEDDVKQFIESTAKDKVAVEKIALQKDKVALRETFKKYDIRGVFNLAQARAKNVDDVNYIMSMHNWTYLRSITNNDQDGMRLTLVFPFSWNHK